MARDKQCKLFMAGLFLCWSRRETVGTGVLRLRCLSQAAQASSHRFASVEERLRQYSTATSQTGDVVGAQNMKSTGEVGAQNKKQTDDRRSTATGQKTDDVVGAQKKRSTDQTDDIAEGENKKLTFTMSFEEYRKLKKSLKLRTRLAGIPMAFVGTTISSAVHIHFNPRMFEMTPEEVQPIL